MKRSYAVYQVDAFTKEKLSGNPAGVVLVCCRVSGTICSSSPRTRSNRAFSAVVYVIFIFTFWHLYFTIN